MPDSKQDDTNANESLRRLPAVGKMLTHPSIQKLAGRVGHDVIARIVRAEVAALRNQLLAQPNQSVDYEQFCRSVAARVRCAVDPSLRNVLNATGIVLHTNLGRAPLSQFAADQVARLAQGYSNLELNLETGKRGSRQTHLREMFRLLTGAEDAVVVNNNAAALLLVLSTLASQREVVVSRGELIEIGDSFRLPDIMKSSGACLLEVGTTNRTRVSDYEQAIGERTALLFKAHTSNFVQYGFTEDVPLSELSALAHRRGLPCVYDIGSGLLRRTPNQSFDREPSVDEALRAGADLVLFSGDKLFGAAQAGIVLGRKDLVAALARAPMMRALRPGRLTLAALQAVMLEQMDEGRLVSSNPVHQMLALSSDQLRLSAEKLAAHLETRGIRTQLVPSKGQVGGGAVPAMALDGWAVKVLPENLTPEDLFTRLIQGAPPILAILREGALLLDVRTLRDEDGPSVAEALETALGVKPQR